MEKIEDAVNAISEVNDIYRAAFDKNNTRDEEFFKTIQSEFDEFNKERNYVKSIVDKIQNNSPFSPKASRFISAMEKKYKEYHKLIGDFYIILSLIIIIACCGKMAGIFPNNNFNILPLMFFYSCYTLFMFYYSTMAMTKAAKRWPAEKITKEEKKIYKEYFKHTWKGYVKWCYFYEIVEHEQHRKDLIEENKKHIQTIEDYNRLVKKYNKIVDVLTHEQLIQFKCSLMETE